MSDEQKGLSADELEAMLDASIRPEFKAWAEGKTEHKRMDVPSIRWSELSDKEFAQKSDEIFQLARRGEIT